MKQSRLSELLKFFNLSQQNFIGKGGESFVYKLNDSYVLRIYKPSNDFKINRIRRLRDFYNSIKTTDVTLEFPHILAIGKFNNVYYSIERYIKGQSLTQYLRKNLNDSDLHNLLLHYVKAASRIREINGINLNYFGEILADNPIRTKTWSEFLKQRVERTLAKSQKDLQHDVINFNNLYSKWLKDIKDLKISRPALVHGDFFPSNVIVDKNGLVKAIIDFSPLTLIGDWRMDIVGAYIYLEVVDSYKLKHSQILQEIIRKFWKNQISEEIISLYKIYYSLYFSFAKKEDTGLYNWCISNLNELAKKL